MKDACYTPLRSLSLNDRTWECAVHKFRVQFFIKHSNVFPPLSLATECVAFLNMFFFALFGKLVCY